MTNTQSLNTQSSATSLSNNPIGAAGGYAVKCVNALGTNNQSAQDDGIFLESAGTHLSLRSGIKARILLMFALPHMKDPQ